MRLLLGSRTVRAGAIVVAAALLATTGVTLATSASAAVSVGTLTFNPTTGLATSPINMTTVSTAPATGCPAGSTNVRAVVNGPPGWTNIPVLTNSSTGVLTTGEFSEPFSDTFAGIAQANGITITAGRYDVSLICQNRLGSTVFGTFDAPIFFTDATHFQSNDPNQVALPTTTVVSAAPVSPQVAGTSVTFTATESPSAAGTVQFMDGAVALGSPQPVSGGIATLTTSALTAGSHSITAVFTPTNTSAFTGSTSTAITYVITAAATTTSTAVTATPASPQLSGTSVTFTATLTPATAAGTVQFKDGAANLGTAQPVSSGTATLATSTLSVASHSISAVFTPTNSSLFTSSTAPALTYVINAGPTTTTTAVTAAPASPQVSGTSVTFTATLTPSNAAGTVQFKDGASSLGAAQAVSAGKATLVTSTLPVATHTISAVFTPTDPTAFTTSTAPGITYVISAPAATPTATALAASPASPATAGTTVNFTATVTPTAAGTVQFKDGATNLGSPVTVSGGQALFSTTTLSVATHTITAVFSPTDTAAFTGSTSPGITYVINAAPAQNTTTTLGASPASPVMAGLPVTFTATVSPSAAGSVQFKDGTIALGSPATVSAGQATLTTSTLSVATHSITAVFTATDPAAFNGSTSAPLPFTISPAPAQSTSTTLTANPTSPVTAGTSVTFTATVSPAAAGTVQFKDGAANLGPAATVSAGQASMTTSSLTVASHSITAVFTPTDPSAFLGSTSPPMTYVVNSPATTTATALSANPASPAASGMAVTFTANVTPAAAAGTVQFMDGATALGTPQTVSGGQATTSTSTLSVATHSITAVFTPTDAAAFSGSTSTPLPYVITGQTTTNLGSLSFTPVTGLDTTPLLLTTHSTGASPGCPTGTTNVRAVINGPAGWANIPAIGNSTSGVSTTADFSVPVADTFSGLAASNSLTIVAGQYDFTLLCQNRLGSTVFGTFIGSIWFTDATHYQNTNPNNTVTTTTAALVVTPDARQDLAKPVTFTATITPAVAAGTVQFTDTVQGVTVNLGSPVTLSGGTATFGTSTLGFGLHTFSAVFTPTDPKVFSPSTAANVVYVIALPAPPKLIRPASMTGSGRFGTVLTCSATFTGATSLSYAWFRNGRVIPGAVHNTYLVGNADRVRVLACRVTARNLGGVTATTSRPLLAGLFSFRLVTPPMIFGHHVIGASLLAFPGNWAPRPAAFFFQWERDGHPIAGATKQIYHVTRADMGHRLSVAVTVQLIFFYPAVAVSRQV
jgi:hypothetical protein